MSLIEIKKLLHKSIGLHTETVGDSSIERAITHRMDTLGIGRTDNYLSKLVQDQDEFNELVEEVVVPETWFFRNLVPFDTLAKCVPDLLKGRSDKSGPIKILSIPCSTGEEPYSIAMTLLQSGLNEAGFIIDAVDISKRALTKARRAIYGKHSFRESSGVADERYFHQTKSGQQLLPIVKDRVNFIQGNILKGDISPTIEYYDIIFCRNLLIYFDRETQREVLEKLHRYLKPDGTLFVGHAETSEVGKIHFNKINVPKAFAYHKKTNMNGSSRTIMDEQPAAKLRLIYDQLVEVTQKDIELSKKRKETFTKRLPSSVVRNEPDSTLGWWRIEKLIEQGHLTEASTLCDEWLKGDRDEAQGYYYLGLISSLEGSIGAADALLKKAIYLDPNHHKALGLSALLADQRGDSDVADSLRRREGRAKKRSL